MTTPTPPHTPPLHIDHNLRMITPNNTAIAAQTILIALADAGMPPAAELQISSDKQGITVVARWRTEAPPVVQKK